MRTFFKHDMEPGVVTRRKRRAAESKQLQECYADVDLRDGGYSWISGRYTQLAAPDPRVRRERHHLKGRRVRPEWIFRAERVITVTAEEHKLIHAGWLIVEGCDARRPVFFHWAAHVTQKPFEIKGRRQRQVEE